MKDTLAETQKKRLDLWLASDSSPAVEKVLETHLSTVVLADRVYKIRKPVKFPFIDQCTPMLRYEAIAREIVRGSHFSPQVYVGIHYLNDDGDMDPVGSCPSEPVLVMQRIPEELCACRMLPKADAATIDKFANDLVAIHAQLPRVPPEEVIENIAYSWDVNLRAMTGEGLPVPAEKLVKLYQEAMWHLNNLKPIITKRASDGYARMGHGDLRLDHVFLTHPLSLIDALDYNPRLCRTDVLAELAFLIMELRALGHYDVASCLAVAYNGDCYTREVVRLTEFFVSYRALVRAKVEWLRHRQLGRYEKVQTLRNFQHLVELSREALGHVG